MGLTSVNSLYKVEAEEFDKAIKLKVWDKVATSNYRSYYEAKLWAKSKKIKSTTEWYNNYRDKGLIPKDIRNFPDAYPEWKNWATFLDTRKVFSGKGFYSTYNEAKKFAKKNNIKTKAEWETFCKSEKFPLNLPRAVAGYYKKTGDWISYGSFFGTNYSVKKNYKSIEDLKSFLKTHKIDSQSKFNVFKKTAEYPSHFPKAPSVYYKRKKTWSNWSDLFDKQPFFYDTLQKDGGENYYLDFEKAKNIVHKLKIKSTSAWTKMIRKNLIPKNIPRYPRTAYKERFKGWGDFLGTGRIADQNKSKFYPTYLEASRYAINNNIKTEAEWHNAYKLKKLPNNYPRNLPAIYKRTGEWKGWPDFLDKKTKS